MPAKTRSLRKPPGRTARRPSRRALRTPRRSVSRLTSRPGIGHSLMPSLSTISRCRPTRAISSARDDEDVQREEARQRLARDDRAAEHHLDELAADERDAPRDRGSDPEAPVRVLVEAQDLAGERHAQRHDEKQHAHDPGELARILERAEEKHLRHVDEHEGDHEVGAPAVHRPQEPAQRLLGVEDEQAPPGLVGRRHVDEREADAGDDLNEEERERAAAEDVQPARRAPGHAMLRGVLQRRSELEAPVEPGEHGADHAHGTPPSHPPAGRADASTWPSVGIMPARIQSRPFSTLCS